MSIRSWWQKKKAEVWGWSIQRWQSGRPYNSDVSNLALVERYRSWVYACANKNAVNCSQVPLRLYVGKPARRVKSDFQTKAIPDETKDYLSKSPSVSRYVRKAMDVEEVLEHPFLDMLANVNEFMNQFDLMEHLFLSQDIMGNAYWAVEKIGTVPVRIWPLLGQYVKVIPDRQNFIKAYEFEATAGDKHFIEPENMIHFKYISLKSWLLGMSPLQAVAVAADLGYAMNLHEAALMQNGARPDLLLSFPVDAGSPNQETKERMYEEWDERFKGTSKAGKLGMLFGGAELKPLQLTPKELNYLQGRKATLTEIAAVFGVPESMLKVEDVNKANAQAGNYMYAKNTLLPRLRRVEQKMNEKLMPMYAPNLFVAFDNPVPEDRDFALKAQESHLKNGYSSINEERERDGLEPVEWGDAPILPSTMMPLGTAPEPMPEPEPAKSVVLLPNFKQRRQLPPLNLPTNFVNIPFVNSLAAVFRAMKADILRQFDKDSDNFKRYNTKDIADDYIAGWFNKAKWEVELSKSIGPFLEYTTMEGGERAMQFVKADDEFVRTNPKVIDSLEKRRYGAIQSTNGTVVKTLRGSLAAGLNLGETIPDLRKRIVETFSKLEAYESARIARTEAIWAWNEGAVQGYIQSGLVSGKEWVVIEDDRSCDYCPALDGQVVDLEENWFDMGDTMQNPNKENQSLSMEYADVGHPPLHPNCRCTVVPVLL